MKKVLNLMPVLAGVWLLSACSSDSTPSPSSGGAGNATAGATSASAGAPAAGAGAPGSAGAPSTGQAGAANGGSAGAGGSVAVAGAANGGAAGSSTGAAGAGGASTGTAGGGAGGSTGATHWVGTWTASPYATASDGMPPASLANSVARQVTHVSLGGSQIRVQFSNKEGKTPLTITAVHVALCKKTPTVDGSIDTTTDKAVTFSGMAGVSVPAGMDMWSDAVDFALPALANVSITTAFGTIPADITSHNGSRTTSYVQTNSTNVSAADMTSAPSNAHWFFISGMDVMASADAKGIVAIGDSITDGRGTTTDGNNRWTDLLAARLQANAATKNVSVMNQGIGATNLQGCNATTDTCADKRFARDVLGQSGVKYAVVFDGVNDIGGGGGTIDNMKAAYAKMISAAHGQSIKIYGVTIMPFGGDHDYWTADHETLREAVNTYIKSGAFDGYIDFEPVVSDGKSGTTMYEPALLASTGTADGLHPGKDGYKAMSDSVDLTLFTK